tara:strand:- start:2824 stop:3228 length:405 start_codon:yes stop_codon:yes gene_type:complete
MMKPIRVQGEGDESTVFVCFHWRTFPVGYAAHPDSAEELRDRKVIDGAEYQRYKAWERECGLLRMDEAKCQACPHIRRLEIRPHQVPMLVKTDGSGEWTPAVDVPNIEAGLRRAPRPSKKQVAAAKVQKAREGG